MRSGLVSIEGQTEEAFVVRTLNPHLANFGLNLTPVVLKTRRVAGGPDHRGGVSSWPKMLRDLRRLSHNSAAVVITTMFDYYGLPSDVPGMKDRPEHDPRAAVARVEAAMNAEVGDRRMRAFVQLHEFEALLYSDPATCGQYLENDGLARMMTRACVDHGGPELVNQSPRTAPSKRIQAIHPSFLKTADGPSIADRIGLPVIRTQCPHFDAWLTFLEQFEPS